MSELTETLYETAGEMPRCKGFPDDDEACQNQALTTTGRYALLCATHKFRRQNGEGGDLSRAGFGRDRQSTATASRPRGAQSGSDGPKGDDLGSLASALVPAARRAQKALHARKSANGEARLALGALREQLQGMIDAIQTLEEATR